MAHCFFDKKLHWKPELKECKKCKRMLPHHAKGLCSGCYNTTFYLESTKDYNHQRDYNIELELYKQITSKCIICGFDKFVELHHLDKNRDNNSKDNLIGLCLNHHRMIHTLKYKDEITQQINKSKLLLLSITKIY